MYVSFSSRYVKSGCLLPTYYTLQFLSEMAAEPISKNCIFVCYSPKITVIVKITNDKDF